MIRQKKPGVILGARQPPKGFGEVKYCSKGVGATDETETIVVGGSPIKLVNAFYPSYSRDGESFRRVSGHKVNST